MFCLCCPTLEQQFLHPVWHWSDALAPLLGMVFCNPFDHPGGVQSNVFQPDDPQNVPVPFSSYSTPLLSCAR